jgi:medium-chain acyl-[acyl-carrier-protein] hydrolase
VQIPGREERLNEPRFTHPIRLVEAITDSLSKLFDRPFALFGHSLGAIIAFQLARQLRREESARPLHLFVSGYQAPQIPDSGPRLQELPVQQFIAALHKRNFIRREIMEKSRMLEFITPILKSDYEMLQNYSYEPEAPLDFPITAFAGEEDFEEGADKLESWREQTRASFSLYTFPGDHFFIHSAQSSLLNIINEQLQAYL